MHVWNVLHAARWKYGMQKIAILAPSHNFVRLYLCSWGMCRQSEKNIDTSPTCTHNMVNFGLVTAEICWRVWGTPANFQRLSRLGSVTARHSSSGRQPNFAALNRRCHLYSAGRPSHWALAHILVCFCIVWLCCVKFSFFTTKARDWLRTTSPKNPARVVQWLYHLGAMCSRAWRAQYAAVPEFNSSRGPSKARPPTWK